MAIQLTQAGDALANVVTTGTSFQASTGSLSITCWINCPWAGVSGGSAQSYVGLYDENQRINSNNNTSTAVQLGSKAANTFNVWTWGGGVLVDSTISMSQYVNQWVFLAYTFDGTSHRCYVNGVLGGTSTNAQLPGNFDRVYINGYTSGGTSETSTFQLDTYNSYARALAQSEILTMYNTHGNRHGIVYQNIVRYELDEYSPGTVVNTIYNQTDFTQVYSNLTAVSPAGSTRVSFISGYADANLRPPQG
jgi:hypothetical protein